MDSWTITNVVAVLNSLVSEDESTEPDETNEKVIEKSGNDILQSNQWHKTFVDFSQAMSDGHYFDIFPTKH